MLVGSPSSLVRIQDLGADGKIIVTDLNIEKVCIFGVVEPVKYEG